jgi:hypothetical protein
MRWLFRGWSPAGALSGSGVGARGGVAWGPPAHARRGITPPPVTAAAHPHSGAAMTRRSVCPHGAARRGRNTHGEIGRRKALHLQRRVQQQVLDAPPPAGRARGARRGRAGPRRAAGGCGGRGMRAARLALLMDGAAGQSDAGLVAATAVAGRGEGAARGAPAARAWEARAAGRGAAAARPPGGGRAWASSGGAAAGGGGTSHHRPRRVGRGPARPDCGGGKKGADSSKGERRGGPRL